MEKTVCNIRFAGVFICMLFMFTSVISQNGFSLPASVSKDKISFELVNNLVIIPVEINGAKLSFILDTGVNSTLLFSFEDIDSLELNNTQPIKIRGLGEGGSIDAHISRNNSVSIGKATDSEHTIYMILDKNINLSMRMGLPIHGIIGFNFFRKFVVKTDYSAKRLTFYRTETYKKKRCKICVEFPLYFHANKPFVKAVVQSEISARDVTLLVDTGSSDGLWLFDEKDFVFEFPKNYFVDFLGLGLSGNIFGKRTKTNSLLLGEFQMEEVTTSFPNLSSIQNMKNFKERDGSLGSEVLRRFTIIMDYANKTMSLKKNRFYKDPFHYNMAGLTVEHDGFIYVKDLNYSRKNTITMNEQRRETSGIVNVYSTPFFQLVLAPKFVVAEVRENSPAALAGIQKGDEVLRVNGRGSYKYKLYELVAMFSSKEGKIIYMEVNRNGIMLRKKFVLKKVL